MNRIQSYCFAFFFLTVLTGCGNPQVTGRVTFSDGTPLKGGMVILQNDQCQGIGDLNPEGEFSIYQIRPGDGLKRGRYLGYIANAVVEDAQGRITGALPDKYTRAETSGITYDSQKDRGTLNIVIER
ncbi:MAG TPA: hypothetical protein DEB39_08950 [Planctomycetaceae bacterium]|nr:hypothetical protein [Planctomycetaceae bacterium]